VNHSVEKQMLALRATHIRVSDECDLLGAGKLSKYIAVLIGPLLFQGWPEELEVLAALLLTR